MACTAVRTLVTPLFCVEEHLLPRGYTMARHVHRHAGIVAGLAGAWIGEVRRDELACRPGDVVVLPDGAAHRERAPATGGRCLLVSLHGAGAVERETLRRFDRHRTVAPPSAGRLARAIAAALRAGDRAQVVEGLALQLLEALGPTAACIDDPRWVRQLREALDAGFLVGADVAALAAAAGRSREHAYRCFRRAFGVSPGAYVRSRRLEHAARLLVGTDLPVAAVAAECRFTDQSHLTRLFRARFGVTPARFRRG